MREKEFDYNCKREIAISHESPQYTGLSAGFDGGHGRQIHHRNKNLLQSPGRQKKLGFYCLTFTPQYDIIFYHLK